MTGSETLAAPPLLAWLGCFTAVAIAWATGLLVWQTLACPWRSSAATMRALSIAIALPLGLLLHGLGYWLWLVALGRVTGLWLLVDLLILGAAAAAAQRWRAQKQPESNRTESTPDPTPSRRTSAGSPDSAESPWASSAGSSCCFSLSPSRTASAPCRWASGTVGCSGTPRPAGCLPRRTTGGSSSPRRCTTPTTR